MLWIITHLLGEWLVGIKVFHMADGIRVILRQKESIKAAFTHKSTIIVQLLYSLISVLCAKPQKDHLGLGTGNPALFLWSDPPHH